MNESKGHGSLNDKPLSIPECIRTLQVAESHLSLTSIPDLLPDALEAEVHISTALMAVKKVRRSLDFPPAPGGAE